MQIKIFVSLILQLYVLKYIFKQCIHKYINTFMYLNTFLFMIGKNAIKRIYDDIMR